jgi:ABC-type polar amino acid transport system ATPase subunit
MMMGCSACFFHVLVFDQGHCAKYHQKQHKATNPKEEKHEHFLKENFSPYRLKKVA